MILLVIAVKKEYLIIVLILTYFLYVKEPEKVYIDSPCLESELFVEVKGEVLNQGVFEVDSSMRVIEVIELAGGFSANADVLSISLSERVYDEMVIIVSEIENKDHNFININKASLSELMMLPKLGLKKAESIINYRDEFGSFTSIEDIKNVSGIGDAIFNDIKDLISTK